MDVFRCFLSDSPNFALFIRDVLYSKSLFTLFYLSKNDMHWRERMKASWFHNKTSYFPVALSSGLGFIVDSIRRITLAGFPATK